MSPSVLKFWIGQAVLFGDGPEPLIRRLDPATRAKVLAALAGLIILGFGMVLLTWLGGRAVRRYMRGRPMEPSWRIHSRKSQDDWAERPLVPNQEDRVPDPESTDS